MTDLLDGVLAAVVAFVVNFVITTRIRSALPPSESRFLARTYLQTLVLRCAVGVLLNAAVGSQQFANYFWGDSSTYDGAGYYLALAWRGDMPYNPYRMSAVSGYGFVHVVAFVYYFFGRNRLLVQFLNATIGAVSVLVIYAIARRLFDDRVARWAALFTAFFPQMIFWSCAIYKDPLILLCIATSIYALIRLRERLSPGYLLLFVAATLALMTLRFYVFYMVAFATMGTFLFSQRRGFLSGLVSQTLVAGAFVAALAFGVRQETIAQQTSYFDLERLQTARAGQTMVGESDFGTEFDVSTPAGALAAIPVGLAYLLFAPFPWAISGVRQLLTLPEMLVWYALMPALVRGLRHSVRHRFREVLPIVTFTLVLTLAYAIFQSNVGAAYRQRTQIVMFFFIFIGAGIELKRNRSEPGRPPISPPPSSWQR
jgi:4-amino-4-deoxy-L-arabinose transferase-like glycosyltransferase